MQQFCIYPAIPLSGKVMAYRTGFVRAAGFHLKNSFTSDSPVIISLK
jgi:hypothetical protein